MKQNYEFPYHFVDRSKDGIVLVQTTFEQEELAVQIDILDYYNNDLIDTAIEFEGSDTFYRSLYILDKPKTVIRIPNQLLGSKIQYYVWLIAREEGEFGIDGIKDFHEKGDCLGMLKKDVITLEPDNGVAGLIKVAKTPTDAIQYDLTSNWITIYLPEDTYKEFNHWHKDPVNTPMALACFGFGCLQFAIIQALNNEEHKQSVWWQTISQMLESHGYDLDELSPADVPGATNKILNNCIHAMIVANAPVNDDNDSNSLS